MNSFFNYCRRYLLICVTISYSAGVWVASAFPIQAEIFSYCAIILLLLTFLAWLLRFNNCAVLLLCLGILCTGTLNADYRRSRIAAGDEISGLLKQRADAVIVGVVEELFLGDEQRSKAILKTHSFRTEAMEFFAQARGKLLVNLFGPWPRNILPGDTVALRARVSSPPVIHTPGTFNYRDYLARRDIHLIGSVPSPLFIQPVTIEGTSDINLFGSAIERYRAAVGHNLNEILPPDAAGLYRALLIGDKSGVSPMVLEHFKRSGVMHILAISGLHLALLGFIIVTSTRWLLSRSERLLLAIDIRKLALLLCLIPLLGYTLLAGAGPPVVRSFFMSVCVVLALTVNRRKSPITLLCGAALFLLVVDPLSLQDVSFQLSFAAVFGLITLTPSMFKWLYPDGLSTETVKLRSRFMKWLWAAITVSSAATIGTLPLLLYHFNRVSLVTIPANLIIEPLICLWSLPCGIVGLMLLPVSQGVAALLFKAGIPGLTLSVKCASLFSSIPLSTIWLPDPHFVVIVLYFSALVILFLPPHPLSPIKVRLALPLCCVGLMLAPLSGLPVQFRDRDQVSFIAIGHGSANLITLSTGQNILIDGGGKSAPGFDTGARILAPFLWQQGIARLDDIIITHPDADHYNGIPALIERFRPRRLWIPARETHKDGLIDLLQLAERYRVDIRYGEDETILNTADVQLTLLRPTQKKYMSEDDRGLVLRLETASFSVLFPGDISKSREQELVDAGEPLDADILLSPHHGSATSNSSEFLAEVSPSYMVVSTGEASGIRFPSEETRKNAQKFNIGVLTTAAHGTVAVTSNDFGYSLTTYRAP